MKKYLLMLAALCSLSFFSCTDKAATDNANTNGEEAKTEKMTEAPKPTGDAEKDAKACVDFMVQTIEKTDFTDKAAQKNLEKTMKSLQEEFEAFYKEKGDEAYKAFLALQPLKKQLLLHRKS